MARRRKVRRGRRRMRRNAWRRQKADHATAAYLGWGYQPRRRKRKRGTPRAYIRRSVGVRRLASFRKRHPVSKRRKSKRRMITFRPKAFGRRYSLAANRNRYSSNPRRRRRRATPARGRGGRFVSRRRGTRKGMRRRTARKAYRRNWFFYDNAPKRRRRRSRQNAFNDNPRRRRRRRPSRRRAYRRNAGRPYMSNPAADILQTIKSVFDVDFLTKTALPVVGGFFASRAVSATLGPAILGDSYTGFIKTAGNFVSAGLAGAAVGIILKDEELAGNVILGGVVNALANLLREVLGGVDFIASSPVLSEAIGLSGMGMVHPQIAAEVEAQVKRELGISDYLTAEQLSRAERIGGVGDYLTAEQLSRSERIGQYPMETAGPSYGPSTEGPLVGQYPAETSGEAMADFADVAAFGG